MTTFVGLWFRLPPKLSQRVLTEGQAHSDNDHTTAYFFTEGKAFPPFSKVVLQFPFPLPCEQLKGANPTVQVAINIHRPWELLNMLIPSEDSQHLRRFTLHSDGELSFFY